MNFVEKYNLVVPSGSDLESRLISQYIASTRDYSPELLSYMIDNVGYRRVVLESYEIVLANNILMEKVRSIGKSILDVLYTDWICTGDLLTMKIMHKRFGTAYINYLITRKDLGIVELEFTLTSEMIKRVIQSGWIEGFKLLYPKNNTDALRIHKWLIKYGMPFECIQFIGAGQYHINRYLAALYKRADILGVLGGLCKGETAVVSDDLEINYLLEQSSFGIIEFSSMLREMEEAKQIPVGLNENIWVRIAIYKQLWHIIPGMEFTKTPGLKAIAIKNGTPDNLLDLF